MIAVVWWAYDPNDVKPGWVALVLVLLLIVATFLLWRSMNNQLRKIKVPRKSELREDDRPGDDSTGRDKPAE